MILNRAECIDLESVPRRFPPELATDLVSEFGDLPVRELDQATCSHADHVITWFEAVDESVVCLLRIEQSLSDDSRFDEQADRAIDGGLRDSVIRPPHVEEQFLDFEDVVAVYDRIKDLGAFGCVLQALGLEVSTEHRADRCHQLRKILSG